eukprot:405187-Ditylum_brightwellii.AAC.1
MQALFNNAAYLYKKNPKFQSSLIVFLFQAAVAKEKSSANAKTEEKIYDPKAASVPSANLGGTSKRWMKTLDACE